MTELQYIENLIYTIDLLIRQDKKTICEWEDRTDEEAKCLKTDLLESIKILEGEKKHATQVLKKLKAFEAVKKYLIVNEGRIYEDSYYKYLTLKNDCISEDESEEECTDVSTIIEALEVKQN